MRQFALFVKPLAFFGLILIVHSIIILFRGPVNSCVPATLFHAGLVALLEIGLCGSWVFSPRESVPCGLSL